MIMENIQGFWQSPSNTRHSNSPYDDADNIIVSEIHGSTFQSVSLSTGSLAHVNNEMQLQYLNSPQQLSLSSLNNNDAASIFASHRDNAATHEKLNEELSPDLSSKPYRCTYQGCKARGFSRRFDRDRHMKKHDEANFKFACNVVGCAKKFYRKEKLKDHMEQGHKKRVRKCTCGVSSKWLSAY
jgi:uncharacterized Zn-finger protein